MGLVLMYLTPSSSHGTKQHSSCKVLMARGVPPFCTSVAVVLWDFLGVSSDYLSNERNLGCLVYIYIYRG